jgi:cytochrome c556
MRKFPLIVVAGALAGCATMEDPAPPPPQLTAQQIVEARQAAFHMSGALMGQMRAAIERDADPKNQTYAARGVARWARALPTMFPDSTRIVTPTRARPEIWANKADFDAKAAAYAAAAERLAEVAASGDKAAFAEQHRATAATCKACHDLYQVPQSRGS